MKFKWLLGCLGAIGLLCVCFYAFSRYAASQDAAALNHELDLARREGLATTWQEYAASIEHASPSENAAQFYRKLSKIPSDKVDLNKLEGNLFFRPSPQHLAEAKAELDFLKPTLKVVDQAAALPKCWFDRDWSKGMAVLMPELAYVKFGSRIVALRGSVAATEGRPSEAIANVDEMLRMAAHIGQERTIIACLVEEGIYAIAAHHLSDWAFVYRDRPEYRKALSEVLAKWPTVDLPHIHRSDLIEVREILADSTTPKGRADLGLKEEDISKAEKFVPIFISRPKADIKIARAMRQIWEAYRLPPKQRIDKMDAGWKDLLPAMVAYPTGADIYFKLSSGGDDNESSGANHNEALMDLIMRSRQLGYLAIAKALEAGAIPKKIDTDNLRSPFDDQPVDYSFDGKQITVNISCPDKAITISPLKLPSDSELKLDEVKPKGRRTK